MRCLCNDKNCQRNLHISIGLFFYLIGLNIVRPLFARQYTILSCVPPSCWYSSTSSCVRKSCITSSITGSSPLYMSNWSMVLCHLCQAVKFLEETSELIHNGKSMLEFDCIILPSILQRNKSQRNIWLKFTKYPTSCATKQLMNLGRVHYILFAIY